MCLSLSHVSFILVKYKLLESQLNGVTARCCYVYTARKPNLELARLAKGPLNDAHISTGCADLQHELLHE